MSKTVILARARERERERERETDRQKDRQTDRDSDRERINIPKIAAMIHNAKRGFFFFINKYHEIVIKQVSCKV